MEDNHPNIVVLDGFALNPGDLSWGPLLAVGNSRIYEHTPQEEIIERAKNAVIVLTNKAVLNASHFEQLPYLKCICVLATGFNNIDTAAARQYGITVCNVVGYGNHSVAQHVFALILTLTNQVSAHNTSVQMGDWSRCRDFSYSLAPIKPLVEMTLGIYGFGKIGQQVAKVAEGFGMTIIAHHKHPERDARSGVEFVTLDDLFLRSDVLSLHAPLTDSNVGIINKNRLQQMKSNAMLINTGRGGLVNEKDLRDALTTNQIAGAALDVLSSEPPPADHILFGLKNCIITPHQAWASRQARQLLLDETIDNINHFLRGHPKNIVNKMSELVVADAFNRLANALHIGIL